MLKETERNKQEGVEQLEGTKEQLEGAENQLEGAEKQLQIVKDLLKGVNKQELADRENAEDITEALTEALTTSKEGGNDDPKEDLKDHLKDQLEDLVKDNQINDLKDEAEDDLSTTPGPKKSLFFRDPLNPQPEVIWRAFENVNTTNKILIFILGNHFHFFRNGRTGAQPDG